MHIFFIRDLALGLKFYQLILDPKVFKFSFQKCLRVFLNIYSIYFIQYSSKIIKVLNWFRIDGFNYKFALKCLFLDSNKNYLDVWRRQFLMKKKTISYVKNILSLVLKVSYFLRCLVLRFSQSRFLIKKVYFVGCMLSMFIFIHWLVTFGDNFSKRS